MNNQKIPVPLAHQTRTMFNVVFYNLRRAENALSEYPSLETREVLDALSRAERELGIADAHLRHYVPDQVLFATRETWFARVYQFWKRKS